MRIKIITPKHRLTKKQRSVIEHLAFTENWETGHHGCLESLDIDGDAEKEMTVEELDENNIKWGIVVNEKV
jgi:hypothetical protein